jgi:25S rRNA (uracil2634-N3)-methyltransferase
MAGEVEEFVHRETIRCAYKESCLPCFYKIFPQWKSKQFPNQRPEMCPRSRNKEFVQGLYSSEMKVLTVGDGDFSFSLSLSNGLRNDPQQPINCIATSYESGETVCSVYPTATQNINKLRAKGVPVLHGVDSTSLETVPFLQEHHRNSFDVIVWNFPCKRAEFGADAQVDDIEENKQLLKGFFKSSRYFLKSSAVAGATTTGEEQRPSEVHITHKTFEPFCWWNILEIAQECGFSCEGTMVFDRCLYPGYVNRKALDKKSFPFNDARVSPPSPSSPFTHNNCPRLLSLSKEEGLRRDRVRLAPSCQRILFFAVSLTTNNRKDCTD